MVILNVIRFSSKKFLKLSRGQFIDSLKLRVNGGHGGNGLPKYGGIGGQGGCVYFVVKKQATLKNLIKKHSTKLIVAGNGEDSSKDRLLGRRGNDIRVEVPPGLTIQDEYGKRMTELNDENAHYVVAGGGYGGCTSNSFLGRPGKMHDITLDLKLIADVGLIGFPNAGKSTLLKAISKASPKIASYPFTTIRPQIGVLSYNDFRQITVADLPGLIEGAHLNIGMGLKFLKHVERTRLLLMIVDIFGFKLSPMHAQRTCLQTIFALNKELELYDESLLDKPCILLLNKIDIDCGDDTVNSLISQYELKDISEKCPTELLPNKFLSFDRIIPISAKNMEHIDQVKSAIRDVLDEYANNALQKSNKKFG